MKSFLTKLSLWTGAVWRRLDPWRKKTVLPYILAIFLLFIFLTVFPVAAGNPSLCGLCHTPRAQHASWKSSSHADTDCFACHAEPSVSGYFGTTIRALANLSKWATFRAVRSPSTYVNNRACLACHSEVAEKISRVGSTRMSHKEVIAAHWKCVDCHSTVGHPQAVARKTYPSKDKCVVCHNSSAAAPTVCETCHLNDVSRKVPSNAVSGGSLAHTASWPKTHGLADINVCEDCHLQPEPLSVERDGKDLVKKKCGSCHGVATVTESGRTGDAWMGVVARMEAKGAFLADTERQIIIEYLQATVGKTPSERPKMDVAKARVLATNAFCQECHQINYFHQSNWASVHSVIAKDAKASCDRCHESSYCVACHVLPMPHPAGWSKKHAETTESVGAETCLRCHGQDLCLICHAQHQEPSESEEAEE